MNRAMIAAVLSSIDGVAGHPSQPPVPAVGSAWPMWVSAVKGTGCDFVDTWHVVIVLPGTDPDATASAEEDFYPAAWQVIRELGTIALVEALGLPVGDGTQPLPVLRFTITTRRARP